MKVSYPSKERISSSTRRISRTMHSYIIKLDMLEISKSHNQSRMLTKICCVCSIEG